MRRTIIPVVAAAVFFGVTAIPPVAADMHMQDMIYGSQMMTDQERNEYRDRMRTAKTDQEREQMRAEHHKKMQARAKERGMKMPEEPPAGGMGGGMMKPGGGMGGRY